jgi:hypothetical protein
MNELTDFIKLINQAIPFERELAAGLVGFLAYWVVALLTRLVNRRGRQRRLDSPEVVDLIECC